MKALIHRRIKPVLLGGDKLPIQVQGEARRAEARRAESGLSFGAGEASSLPHQLEDLGSAASSPSGVRGRAPAAKRSYCIPEVPDGLLELDEANFEGGAWPP